jgi:hypothetical protein
MCAAPQERNMSIDRAQHTICVVNSDLEVILWYLNLIRLADYPRGDVSLRCVLFQFISGQRGLLDQMFLCGHLCAPFFILANIFVIICHFGSWVVKNMRPLYADTLGVETESKFLSRPATRTLMIIFKMHFQLFDYCD